MFKRRLFMLVVAAFGAINVFAEETSQSVGDFDGLLAAINNAEIQEIILTASFDAPSVILINRDGVTLDGGGFTISNTNSDTSTSSAQMNLLNVTGNNVTIKNVVLTGSIGNGLCFVNATGGVVENVTVSDNAKGGLQVVTSYVDAKGIKTSGNDWYGVGVGYTAGTPLVDDPLFTFDETSSFEDNIQISSTNREYVQETLPTGWIAIAPTNENPEYVFTNRTLAEVGSYNDLLTAINDPAKVSIQLTADISASAALLINRDGVTFDGGGFKITSTNTDNSSSAAMNILNVVGNNVTIKNMILTGSIGNGLCFVNATGGTVENVTLTDNAKGGLQIVTSYVTANGIKTSGNTWYGVGVGMTAGTPLLEEPLFTFDNTSTFEEDIPIKTEKMEYVSTLPDGWISIPLNDDKNEIILTKKKEEGGKTLVEINSGDALAQILNSEATQDNFDGIVLGSASDSDTEIVLTAPLSINSNISISSEDPAKPVTIVAPEGKPVFTVSDDVILTLDNINLNGSLQGEVSPLIVVEDGATVEINNSTITGAIDENNPLIQSSGKLYLSDIHFENLEPKAVVTRSILTRAGSSKVVIDAGADEAMIDRIVLNDSELDEYMFITGSMVTLSNSLFYNNGNMKLISIEGGDVKLVNNTFINSTTTGANEVISQTAGTADIFNNILFTGAEEAISSTGGTLNASHNALKTATTPEVNSIALKNLAEIKFVSSSDFRLSSDSPLVGRGDPDQVVGDQDVAGNARKTGSNVNIGAYEAVYTVSEPGTEEPSFDPDLVPELVLDGQDEQSVDIHWARMEEAYSYQVNVYMITDDNQKVPVASYEYRNNDVMSDGELVFHIEGLDNTKSYLIEVSAYNIFNDELVTRTIMVEATVNPTGAIGINTSVNVYSQANTLVVESENLTRIVVANIIGKIVYKGSVQGSVQIPVNEGVYIIHLSGEETATYKMYVSQ